jgi:cytochrome c
MDHKFPSFFDRVSGFPNTMSAKRLCCAERFGLVIFRSMLRRTLAVVLCLNATMTFAQSTVSPSAVRGSANSARESSRAAAAIDAGRIVFNQRCEICHYIDSKAQKIGPGLKGLFARARFADGTKVSEASVARIIEDGGKDMPDYKTLLRAGQLQALIAYLKSR